MLHPRSVERSYDRFGVYAILHHKGDFGAAAQVKDANQAQKKRDADAADSK